MTFQYKMRPLLRNFGPMLAMLLALIIAFSFYVHAEKQIDQANNIRYQSFVLADQLRQSSDDLTRMARTYVVTGDPRYKKYYQDILDIRDGKQPQPNGYEYAYWDRVLGGSSLQAQASTGVAIALMEQMRQAGITDDELRNLAEAKANSDGLTATEFDAMKLAESVGSDAEANRAKALMMLYDASYHHSKAAIMQPINEVYVHMNKRTADAVHAAESKATAFRFLFALFLLGAMMMFWRNRASLQASKLKYQKANDQLRIAATVFETQEAISIADRDLRILRVNRAYCELTGYTADEVIGHSTALLKSGQHDAAFYEEMYSHLKQTGYWAGQIWDKRKNGEIYPARLAISVVRDAAGEVSHYVSTSVDLTGHLKHEKQLADIERFTHGVLDALTSHIAVLDGNGVIVFTNRAWREYAQRNGQPPEWVGEGVDYLGACQQGEVMGDEAAAIATALIQNLIGGRCVEGSFEYPCCSSQKKCWFVCRGTCFSTDGAVYVVMLHTDITERVQGEADLRRLNENLDATLQAIPDLLFDVDEHGRYHEIWVQDTALLAAQKERLLGATVSEMLPPDAAQTILDALREATETGVSRGQQIRLPLPHGEFWFELSTASKQGKPGEPLRFIMLSRNITERKQAELALYESEQRFRDLVDSTDGIVWEADAATFDFTFVSNNAERMLGYPVDDWLQTGFWASHIHPDDCAQAVQYCVACTGRSEDHNFSYRFIAQDGRVVWLNDKVVVVEEGGKPKWLRGLMVDITEQKQASDTLFKLNQELELRVLERTVALQQTNMALAAVEEETRAVVYHMVDSTITFDESGLIRSVNAVTEKIFGYSVDELLGQEVFMLMSESARAIYAGDLENYRHTGMSGIIGVSIEGEGVHKSGERIALEVTLSEYAIQGKHYFSAVLRDIGERVRIMKALEQARLDAEQASLAKSAFLAAMSHEIRTPMNGVIGMVDILQQTSLKSHQMEIVDTVRDSAYSLLGIIEDILDFSKIEAGRLEIEHESLSVTAVVEQVCKMLDHLATKKAVEFTLFIDAEIPEEVLGDALRLRQILINLVNNAIKFSSGGQRSGKVSLRVAPAERSPENMTIAFVVTDNGIGMDEATQTQLFTSFSQADVSTTRRFGGTGLGLAIASNLAKLMGGDITVSSVLDQGSTFTVRLPFRVLPAKPDVSAVASPVAGLACLVVGSQVGLGDDFAAYLTQGGAGVARVSDLSLARQWASPAGLVVWVIDMGSERLSADELHTAAAARSDQEIRFVLIGRGQRRKPRAATGGWVVVDGNALSRQTFLHAVAMAAGRVLPEVELKSLSDKTEMELIPPSREEALQLGRLILVAEDNEINQKVILRQLGLLGFTADIAKNGREALARWESGDYALLLTDLHMPEMDGYELCQAIRHSETSDEHIPIITLTANALQGEAERCRMAGMDDYLSKPISLATLEAMLNKWLPVGVTSELPAGLFSTAEANLTTSYYVAASDPPPAAKPLGVDVSVLKALVGDDAEVVRDFLQDFRASAASIAAELYVACQRNQAAVVGALAHKLKSSSRAVGAMTLGEVCAAMEVAGKNSDHETLAALLPEFEQAMIAVNASLDALLL